jgi:hypothetical protein
MHVLKEPVTATSCARVRAGSYLPLQPLVQLSLVAYNHAVVLRSSCTHVSHVLQRFVFVIFKAQSSTVPCGPHTPHLPHCTHSTSTPDHTLLLRVLREPQSGYSPPSARVRPRPSLAMALSRPPQARRTYILLPASYQRILPQTHARGPTHYTRSPAQITSSTASPPSSDSRAQHTRPKASRFKFLGHLFLLALAMRI